MATNWIVLVDSDLNDYLVSVQLDAFRTLLLAAGQVNPFTKIMTDVAYQIRQKIQSDLQNTVSATANSIPPECKWIGCLLIIDAMQGRFPDVALSDHQREQISRAYKALDRIADGKDLVTRPTDPLPTDVQKGGKAYVIDTNQETAVRKVVSGTMEGL